MRSRQTAAALEFADRVSTLAAIADAIRAKLNPNPADITAVMGDIAKLLDASITRVDMPAKSAPVMDLSKIDFQALRSRFKESRQKNTDLEVLKATIRAQLEKLIRLNKTRADFAEKFEELIESYNAGSRNIEELYEELVKLSRNLSEEQQRHVRENMSEEELVIFDILTRPAPELSTAERAEVKKVARELLNRLKQLFVLNWRQKSAKRSQLKLAIEDVPITPRASCFCLPRDGVLLPVKWPAGSEAPCRAVHGVNPPFTSNSHFDGAARLRVGVERWTRVH